MGKKFKPQFLPLWESTLTELTYFDSKAEQYQLGKYRHTVQLKKELQKLTLTQLSHLSMDVWFYMRH